MRISETRFELAVDPNDAPHAQALEDKVTLGGSLLTMAFVLLLGANGVITCIYLLVRGMSQGSTQLADLAMLAAWSVVAASLVWVRGNGPLRLLMASAPLLLLAALLAYAAYIYR